MNELTLNASGCPNCRQINFVLNVSTISTREELTVGVHTIIAMLVVVIEMKVFVEVVVETVTLFKQYAL